MKIPYQFVYVMGVCIVLDKNELHCLGQLKGFLLILFIKSLEALNLLSGKY